MKGIKHAVRFLACVGVASFLIGCGPQAKPEELLQLEELRASEEAPGINAGAPDAFKKCTDLTNKAIDAWQDGEQAQAKSYAALGQRQYATARAQAKAKEANGREEAAKKEMETLTAQMSTLEAKKEGLEKSISLMKNQISNNDIANVENRIQMAMTEREKAAGVDAANTQKDTFASAEEKLKLAGELNAKGERDQAGAAAEEARMLFSKAYEAAKPEFDKKQQSQQAAEKQKAVFEEAQSIVGPTYVITDMRSTVIVVAGAFEKDKSDLLPIKHDTVRRIADLAKKYPDATITIEGYAQTRTKNYFEVSQRRVDNVRDFIVSQGVDYKRLMTTAKGKESPRYDEKKKENRAMNDRVEIIITLP